MDKQVERIRIKDIAQMAEVSVGTVDRVLHGRTGVSEASRRLFVRRKLAIYVRY